MGSSHNPTPFRHQGRLERWACILQSRSTASVFQLMISWWGQELLKNAAETERQVSGIYNSPLANLETSYGLPVLRGDVVA